ncbi:MAG: FAD-binding oxidoreductase [Myxococcales bacterium]|nr:FAD-binding oxidoreductase [Myxococcales bacterium]
MNKPFERRGLATDLAAIVGEGNVSVRQADKIAYSRDMWPKAQIWVHQGDSCRYPPDCIVWPHSVEQVQQLLSFCHERRIPIIPYGAGSGVCGGTIPIRGGVIIDLKALNRVLHIDDRALTVEAESGIIGQHLEMELERRGYTLGHFPSSIYCSTLGGWLAARSAGQYSSKYGKIEDMVSRLEVVLPGGQLFTTPRVPAPLGGVDWNQLFVGSEGCLGVITTSVLKMHPAPIKRSFRGFTFPSVREGTEGIRTVMQAGLTPCLLRLYDPFDSLIAYQSDAAALSADQALQSLIKALTSSGPKSTPKRRATRFGDWQRALKKQAVRMILSRPSMLNMAVERLSERCLMVIGFEGTSEHVDDSDALATGLLAARGARDLGPEPGRHWYEHRYAISYKQSPLYAVGAFVDTMEVASTWDRLLPMYAAVKRAVAPYGFIMAHFSHAYTEGCSIYFTFAACDSDPQALEERYDRLWGAGLRAVVEQSGTISHHHGVGMSKAHFMTNEYGDGVSLFAGLKKMLDPHGIMNPGKLWPDAELIDAGVELAGATRGE